MSISSECVGRQLVESQEEVSVRRILTYAAGIGDTSAAVFEQQPRQISARAFPTRRIPSLMSASTSAK